MAKELLFIVGLFLTIYCIIFVIVSVTAQIMQFIIAKHTGKMYQFKGEPFILLWSALIFIAVLSWRYLVI